MSKLFATFTIVLYLQWFVIVTASSFNSVLQQTTSIEQIDQLLALYSHSFNLNIDAFVTSANKYLELAPHVHSTCSLNLVYLLLNTSTKDIWKNTTEKKINQFLKPLAFITPAEQSTLFYQMMCKIYEKLPRVQSPTKKLPILFQNLFYIFLRTNQTSKAEKIVKQIDKLDLNKQISVQYLHALFGVYIQSYNADIETRLKLKSIFSQIINYPRHAKHCTIVNFVYKLTRLPSEQAFTILNNLLRDLMNEKLYQIILCILHSFTESFVLSNVDLLNIQQEAVVNIGNKFQLYIGNSQTKLLSNLLCEAYDSPFGVTCNLVIQIFWNTLGVLSFDKQFDIVESLEIELLLSRPKKYVFSNILPLIRLMEELQQTFVTNGSMWKINFQSIAKVTRTAEWMSINRQRHDQLRFLLTHLLTETSNKLQKQLQHMAFQNVWPECIWKDLVRLDIMATVCLHQTDHMKQHIIDRIIMYKIDIWSFVFFNCEKCIYDLYGFDIPTTHFILLYLTQYKGKQQLNVSKPNRFIAHHQQWIVMKEFSMLYRMNIMTAPVSEAVLIYDKNEFTSM
eukprot:279542_1